MTQSTRSQATMRSGVVVKFDAGRGFGFIRPEGVNGADGQDVFVHISSVVGRKPLHPGQHVTYRLSSTEKGPAAADVQPGSVLGVPVLKYGLSGLVVAAAVLLVLGLLLGWPVTAGLWLGFWVLGASAANFALFGLDKSRAQRGGERVPEVVLQGMSLLGGWPGALVGMRVFHHKTVKREFQVVFWLIFALQAGVLLFLLLRG